MRAIDPNYKPPENDGFDKFPAGKYKVNSFSWFTLNENKQPILVAQKDMRMVGRLRFVLSNGKEGPPFSLTLNDMSLLVKAFGKDAKALPPQPELNQPGRITEYMQEVEKLCTGKEVEVEVSDSGWVSSVKGMEPPPDYYYFVLSDLGPKDENGQPYHKEGQYGHYFFAEFEIRKGEGGSETPYKGAKFTELISYAVEVKDGKPDWERTEKTGQYTAAAVRLSNLIRSTAPSMRLLESDYMFSNPHNILPDWLKHAKNDNVMLKGNRVKNDDNKRIQLAWTTLQVVDNVSMNHEERNLNETDIKSRKILHELFNHLANNEETVQNDNLTPKGIELARTYITPLKQSGKVKHGSFSELDHDDILAIFNYVIEMRAEDTKAKELQINLIHAGVGFDPPSPLEKVQDEWGSDSPF